MKKLILGVLFLAFSNNVFAEKVLPITKGNYLLGGWISSYYYDNEIFHKTFSIGISPNIGYFILDNLALGVRPTAHYQYTNQGGGNEYNYYSWGLNIFGKYYFNNGFLAELSGGAIVDQDNKIFYSLFPRIGYAYFINNKVSIEGLIGPNFHLGDHEYFEIPLSIGFQVFL